MAITLFVVSVSLLSQFPKTQQRFRSAFKIANEAILSPQELEDQERRELFLWHQRGVQTLALQEGIEQGREEGERRKAIAIAKQLLGVLKDEAIATTTGLSMAEVQALRPSAPLGTEENG